ncbi:hypothetical protein BSZ35_18780 [Salinibacter sp. 10B]|uniref:outer membrane beta-barrel protein n=1 Tax=Salinibacter sp. 10B TaxID=1923971 RepID=UPI000D282008|nr:outer membrane beta-barrel protein [Salinibacter sp. 10B]PQJ26964.1 hypothetical protein BSZ35_18780 [Salinibacter sp. 10B]
MRYFFITFVGALLLLISTPTVAQDRFGVELRVGPEFATQDLGNANLNTGFGSEVVFSYRFLSHLGAYGGWGYGRMSADGNSFAGTDIDVEETGYTFGLQFIHPIRTSRYGYFLRAGGIYNHIEVENTDGDITADSGHGFGWQIGAGPVITLGQNWQLMPGLRYRSLSRDIEIGGLNTDVDLTYFTAGVGIMRTF